MAGATSRRADARLGAGDGLRQGEEQGHVAVDALLLESLADLDDRIGLDRLRALHANDAKAPLGSNRDRHDNIGDGLIGEGLGVFLAHPKLQGLPVVLEVPGKDGKGPNAEEIRKLRELHARATS